MYPPLITEEQAMELKVWRRVLDAITKDRATREFLVRKEKGSYSVSGIIGLYRSARYGVGNIRGTARGNQPDDPLLTPIGKRVKNRLEPLITNKIGADYPRTVFKVTVGENPNGDGDGRRGVVHLTVRHMYYERVWKPLYENSVGDTIVGPWFILSADKYKLNQRHLELYECHGFNLKTKENKKVYVGRHTLNPKGVTFIRHTANTAIVAAHDHMETLITERLQGERA